MLARRALVSTQTLLARGGDVSRAVRHSSRQQLPRDVPNGSNKKKWAFYLVLGGATVLLVGWAAWRKKPLVPPPEKRKRVVVLGSGWAALQVVREIDTDYYDVSVVSPRNYFLFTPLLASASIGTVEFLSVVEPLRKFCKRSNTVIDYYEAICTDVYYDKNKIRCEESTSVPSQVTSFELDYDVLVVAVGSSTSNMGVKGVQENCFFLKDITDSKKIRQRVMDCLETAHYPNQTQEERDRLLHFVICGGGPTGVEFSAELHDFVEQDIPTYFPRLAGHVRITLVQSAEHILNTYDYKISEYAEKEFKREDINLITNARVTEVRPTEIVLFDKTKNQSAVLPCGMTVWATGIGPTPLTSKIADSIPEQQHNKALVADEYLRVKGIPNNNVYAIGDCLTVTQHKVMDKMVELFTDADLNKDGALSPHELKHLFRKILPDYPQLESFTHGIKKLIKEYDINQDGKLQLDEFQNLVVEVDRNLKTVPSTAQAASQAGLYLAQSLNELARQGNQAVIHPFFYRHLGSFAYVGGDHAVLDTSQFKGGGFGVWWLWRATYFSKQLSWRNRFSLAFDWWKTRIAGRDISKV